MRPWLPGVAGGPLFSGCQVLAECANVGLSFALTTGMFAFTYKYLPRVRIAWQDVWLGAAVTAVLFSVRKMVVGLYIGRSGVASGFGAASSIVVLVVWVYYSAQIFLAGAEFTWVYAHRYGSRRAARETPGELVPTRAPPTLDPTGSNAAVTAPRPS